MCLAYQGSTNSFTGKLRGEDVTLRGVDVVDTTLTKRDSVELARLRNEFNTIVRKEFLMDLGKNPEYLKNAGFSDIDTILDSNGQGTGLEYLGTDGNWYHESVLKEFLRGGSPNPIFNEEAARMTHIPLGGK